MGVAVKYTIADYNQMIADGVFEGDPRPRVELIEGEIQEMSPIGPSHENVVDRLARWSFMNTDGKQVRVRVQNSVDLPELSSVPEPDLLWVAEADYRIDRPTSSVVLLAIEVADSSLAKDKGIKARLYALAGIADYWVVDVQRRRIEVFRDPEGEEYKIVATYGLGDIVRPLAFPLVQLPVSEIFE